MTSNTVATTPWGWWAAIDHGSVLVLEGAEGSRGGREAEGRSGGKGAEGEEQREEVEGERM